MEHWIIMDANGDELWRGGGAPGSSQQQQIPEGSSLVLVPQQVVASRDLDLPALRNALMSGVDAQAEAVRMSFLTSGSGQAMTYQRKEAEARAYVADSASSVPFLEAEATARAITLPALAAEVIQLADTWTLIGSKIEGLRMGAKAAIAKAATLGAIVSAGRVAWETINVEG